VTCHPENKQPWGYVLEEGRKLNQQYPMEAGLWYPGGDITTNKFVHELNVALFHWGPAYLIDVSEILVSCYNTSLNFIFNKRV
jgi:alcohol-forming fatty acyl-CoA reductase